MMRFSRGFGLSVAAWLLSGCAGLALPQETPSAQPAAALAASEPGVVLRGGTVMTAAGPTLQGADVLLRGGRIAAVGPGLEAPAGTREIDVTGRWITPGLIDVHSHLGVYAIPGTPANADGNEATDPFTPEVRAAESFWPGDPAIRRAVAGGVTTAQILPGSANLVGGQGATLRLRPALSAEELRFADAPATMKMACGENPKRVYGERKRAPSTRMGEVALLRDRLGKARAYQAKTRKPGEAPDLGLAALAEVLDGDTLIQNHCYRADEMLLRLALFREFDVAPRAFHHAVEAYKIRAQLAEANVGAAVWADWWGFKLEAFDGVPAGAAMLDAAGVKVAIHSDSNRDIQYLNQEAAKAAAAGRRAGLEVSDEAALRWITAHPAWLIGVEERVGTLEPGKDADVVIWSGPPLSVYARAELVFIEGELVYDRSSPDLYPRSDFELGIPGTR
jgi:imidazolonepropionase-like amidohydrolase